MTALAASIGTGNIAGAATALEAGGPGAIFWMWFSACLGMMTSFAEKSLGSQYRYRSPGGPWQGGPMAYMQNGMQAPALAVAYSLLCILASFGIGNMAQSNSIAEGLLSAFAVPKAYTGIVVAALAALVIAGGIQRIGRVSAKLVPAMALAYLAGGIFVIAKNAQLLPGAFRLIFSEAFNFRAAFGGAAGYGISAALRCGVSRGVFSNEAGLGASVMAYEASDGRDAKEAGMWGVFEVFCDTIIVCTVSALAILVSGAYDMQAFYENSVKHIPNISGTALAAKAFALHMPFGKQFVGISLCLFAFSSILGWCQYGMSAVRYVFGPKAVGAYKAAFLFFILPGALGGLEFIWSLSDSFNGMMAIPNLIALAALRKQALWPLKAD